MLFREMTLSDLNTVWEIEKRVHSHSWSKQILSDVISSTKACVLMEDNHQIVGFGVLSFVVGEAELLNICIDSRFQGKGMGKKLLQHLVQLATERENTDMFLEVRESNLPAHQLYINTGFNEIGRRKNYYPTNSGREDAILMALPLVHV